MKSHIVYEQRLVLMQRTKTNIKRIQSSHASIYGIQYGKNYKTPNVIYTPPLPSPLPLLTSCPQISEAGMGTAKSPPKYNPKGG